MTALPDPMGFTERALVVRGALVDREGAALVALLPPALAAELALPEEVTLSPHPAEGGTTVSCGVGSPTLERLTTEFRKGAPWATVAPLVEPPRVTHATALAGRLVVRNGLSEVLDASVGEGWYARVTEAWSVEADDRYEGLAVAHAGPDGSEPDAAVQDLMDLSEHDPPETRSAIDPDTLRALLHALPVRVARALAAATAGPLGSIEHRHARDHGRMGEYFTGLLGELGQGRRKVDPAVLAARTAAIVAERDARMRDLVLRYTPRVTCTPAALVLASLPVVRVRLQLRRRKATGELRVTLAAGAASLDALACAGCGGATVRPALCDDRLHCLCEKCVPQPTGRFTCAACAGGRR